MYPKDFFLMNTSGRGLYQIFQIFMIILQTDKGKLLQQWEVRLSYGLLCLCTFHNIGTKRSVGATVSYGHISTSNYIQVFISLFEIGFWNKKHSKAMFLNLELLAWRVKFSIVLIEKKSLVHSFNSWNLRSSVNTEKYLLPLFLSDKKGLDLKIRSEQFHMNCNLV